MIQQIKVIQSWHSALWWARHGYKITGLRAMRDGLRFYILEPRR